MASNEKEPKLGRDNESKEDLEKGGDGGEELGKAAQKEGGTKDFRLQTLDVGDEREAIYRKKWYQIWFAPLLFPSNSLSLSALT